MPPPPTICRLINYLSSYGNKPGPQRQTTAVYGFTLIELLVVVLIIGILAAIAIPQYTLSVTKTRAMTRLTMFKSIVDSQDRYFLENGTWPQAFDNLDIDFPSDCPLTVGDGSSVNDVVQCGKGSNVQAHYRLYNSGSVKMTFKFDPSTTEGLIQVAFFPTNSTAGAPDGFKNKYLIDTSYREFTSAHKRLLGALGAKPTSIAKYYELPL